MIAYRVPEQNRALCSLCKACEVNNGVEKDVKCVKVIGQQSFVSLEWSGSTPSTKTLAPLAQSGISSAPDAAPSIAAGSA